MLVINLPACVSAVGEGADERPGGNLRHGLQAVMGFWQRWVMGLHVAAAHCSLARSSLLFQGTTRRQASQLGITQRGQAGSHARKQAAAGLQHTLQSHLGICAGGGFHVATALDFAVGSCRAKAGRTTVFKS